MEALGARRGELIDMESDGRGRARLEYRIPARGLIGFQGEFMNLTRGTGLMSHVFDGYAPVKGDIPERRNGVLMSQEDGDAVAYALWKLQERGRMFVSPGEKLYEGMIIGIHSRDNDLVVNPIKGKQLTNVRASGKDEAIAARRRRSSSRSSTRSSSSPTTSWSRSRRSRSASASGILKEHERKRAARDVAGAGEVRAAAG